MPACTATCNIASYWHWNWDASAAPRLSCDSLVHMHCCRGCAYSGLPPPSSAPWAPPPAQSCPWCCREGRGLGFGPRVVGRGDSTSVLQCPTLWLHSTPYPDTMNIIADPQGPKSKSTQTDMKSISGYWAAHQMTSPSRATTLLMRHSLGSSGELQGHQR